MNVFASRTTQFVIARLDRAIQVIKYAPQSGALIAWIPRLNRGMTKCGGVGFNKPGGFSESQEPLI
jgi:hypothetical protein